MDHISEITKRKQNQIEPSTSEIVVEDEVERDVSEVEVAREKLKTLILDE